MKSFLQTCSLFILFAVTNDVSAQADMTLTISQLLSWQLPVGNQSNVCTTPIFPREHITNFQISSGLDTNAKILYCPDGMNNFGPYIDYDTKFNLFNFSHWQYIDILCWFGGSASEPILIPSKAWVDAAHKNGVKVIGTVFMAPAAFGGSQAQMQSFLQQDSVGNFIAVEKLIQIANHYNFDGWILNFETGVNSTTGALAASFVDKLDSAYSGEVIWYDAMLVSGSISYQNKLNANNAYFFQHSTGLFTNYNWSTSATVTSSATYATGMGLSPYNVYTGADMWPGRPAQTAFTDYTWIDNIISGGVAKTSIAMFAMNFTFNYAPFSNFNNDSTDYNSFYSTERKIFSGLDEDPFVIDATWKGLGHYISARTPITTLPFQSEFCTGHGLKWFSFGNIIAPTSWHNMSLQSYLPTWTFNQQNISINYDFDDAYIGGSSLSIAGTSGGTFNIPLFSTSLIVNTNLGSGLTIKSLSSSVDSIELEFTRSGASTVHSTFQPTFNGSWENLFSGISGIGISDTITSINFVIYATNAFSLNLGQIVVKDSLASVIEDATEYSELKIYQSSDGSIQISNRGEQDGSLYFYDLNGKLVTSIQVSNHSDYKINLSQNVYLYEFYTKNGNRKDKLIVY